MDFGRAAGLAAGQGDNHMIVDVLAGGSIFLFGVVVGGFAVYAMRRRIRDRQSRMEERATR